MALSRKGGNRQKNPQRPLSRAATGAVSGVLRSRIPPDKTGPIAKSPAQVTSLLLAWNSGDQSAFERLAPIVYGELKRLARGTWRASVTATPFSRPTS